MTICESRERFDSGSANRENQRYRGRNELGALSDIQERMSYYEKKYRKSKKRVKKLISDNATEKTWHLELQSNHCNLVT